MDDKYALSCKIKLLEQVLVASGCWFFDNERKQINEKSSNNQRIYRIKRIEKIGVIGG
ncbi:MAG: hypothetical protein U9Q83_00185 [Bacteroidota bacterium]|nr:hypothetical protein [Bacteroidota bacterium]